MATVYVRSTDGNDADDGSTWALADATLAASVTAAGAGGRSYVSQAHAESQAAAINIASPGTAASPTEIICGNDAAEPPTAVATTATVSSTGANSINFSGFGYCRGLTLSAGSGNSVANLSFASTSAWWWKLVNCVLKLNTTHITGRILLGAAVSNGADDQKFEAVDTDFVLSNASQSIRPCGFNSIIRGTIAATGTVPTTCFVPSADGFFDLELRGVDLSAFGSGKNLIDVGAVSSSGRMRLFNCKLGSSVSITTGTHVGQGGIVVEGFKCDAADTNYRYFKRCYQGDIDSETTIVRTGGATDGTTPFSYKLVSSANTKFYSPLESPWVYYWLDSTGAHTLTGEVVTDNVTLTDREAWLEVEYLGTSGYPVSSFASDRAADILATGANQTTSSETWTTTGLGTPVKQKLSTSVTVQEKGLIRARFLLARPSTTMYACPLILSGSARQFMVGESGFANEAATAVIKRHPGMSGGLAA